MLVLGRQEVTALLEPGPLVEAVSLALEDLSAGRASMPQRMGAWTAERAGLLGAMVAFVPSLDSLAAKLVAVFPGNAGGPHPTHRAVVVAFDPRTGAPLALLDGESITALRTAAASALATRLLARADASVLAIVGNGVQAAAHARAVSRVRAFRELRVGGRDAGRVAQFVAELGSEHAPELPTGLAVRACASIEEAVRGADVVCATTNAAEPVLRRAWLRPGAHLCSVGFSASGRELGADVFADALVAVESRAAAFAPPPAGANDLVEAAALGAVAQRDAVELGELLLGTRQGRASPEQLTVYKSVGVAAEDAAAAALVLRRARERGLGHTLSLE